LVSGSWHAEGNKITLSPKTGAGPFMSDTFHGFIIRSIHGRTALLRNGDVEVEGNLWIQDNMANQSKCPTP
jgi:hypothetical protein